jgi:NitT/TauT family transport system permease protein
MADQERRQIIPFRKMWGNASAIISHYQKVWWIDVSLLLAFIGIIFGIFNLSHEWTGVYRSKVEIDLSPWALPKYTFYSLCRGLIAYALSLVFTLAYGYWAAKDHVAEKVLIPLLDIAQSIPVLGILPGLLIAMVALFPHNNVGLELAAIISIFTGQVWNMTFSFYQSLRSIPLYLQEAAAVYRFNWLQKALKLEIPFSAIGLIWNSMMSMAGGWFFLTVCESFQFKDKDFRLPGLGSYMSYADEHKDGWAKLYGIIAMVLMIVLLDQLLWRPLVVWGQKFRVEEGGAEEGMNSWFLDLIHRSRIIQFFVRLFIPRVPTEAPAPGPAGAPALPKPAQALPALPRGRGFRERLAKTVSLVIFLGLLVSMGAGIYFLVKLFSKVSWDQWMMILEEAGLTLGRVLLAVGLSLIWTIPVGLKIGFSPRLSRIAQPFIQIAASFPSPMLFSYVLLVMKFLGVSLGWGSIALMLLGAQWYILFNVVAGAMAIPSDLLEAARMYNITGWQKFTKVYMPGIFPYLVTGMVTAAGGTWNASIVAEIVTDAGQTLTTFGLGSQISISAGNEDYPMLAASVMVLSLMVVGFNRLVWKRLYRLAEEKYSLSK